MRDIDLAKQHKFVTAGKRYPPVYMYIKDHLGSTCAFCNVVNKPMYSSRKESLNERMEELVRITGLDLSHSCFCESCFKLLLNDVDSLVFQYKLGVL